PGRRARRTARQGAAYQPRQHLRRAPGHDDGQGDRGADDTPDGRVFEQRRERGHDDEDLTGTAAIGPSGYRVIGLFREGTLLIGKGTRHVAVTPPRPVPSSICAIVKSALDPMTQWPGGPMMWGPSDLVPLEPSIQRRAAQPERPCRAADVAL